MPDVLLFGATGYTGRLTAQALAARGASFIVAGRDRIKLEELAADTGAAGVAVAEVGDVPALTTAAAEVRVLLSCVGPFTSLGRTATDAALAAKVNYLDSTGEGEFIAELIERCDAPAQAAHIAMAPAMGFDEVPGDVAAALATEGFGVCDLVLTYAVTATPSQGTIRSAVGIVSTPARWIEGGRFRNVPAGEQERWAPLPPPLGPSRSISFPLAEAYLAPRHIDLRSLKVFMVANRGARLGVRIAEGALRAAGSTGVGTLVDAALARGRGGPGETDRAGHAWTILAEATSNGRRRAVAMSGRDLYGLTAELLATGAMEMARPDYEPTGVLAPVQAVSVENWRRELARHAVSIEIFESG
ncbi:MAG TPA: hypothetical protein VHV50_02200 [Actinomycetota bacterium]|nr:hypothetical protein [Actinomycetota bacterium]